MARIEEKGIMGEAIGEAVLVNAGSIAWDTRT
jgi:hypothetical protein